jgi:hypothetical protein
MHLAEQKKHLKQVLFAVFYGEKSVRRREVLT